MGFIYKITDNTNNAIYIGSTKQALKLRLQNHIRHYRKYIKDGNYSYCISYDIIKNNDYKIELIEETDDLQIREQYWIDNTECINKYNAKTDNKEYKQKWYENNKERLLFKSKVYTEQNKEKIKEYQKQYKQENKEKQRIYMKEYRAKKKIEDAFS